MDWILDNHKIYETESKTSQIKNSMQNELNDTKPTNVGVKFSSQLELWINEALD